MITHINSLVVNEVHMLSFRSFAHAYIAAAYSLIDALTHIVVAINITTSDFSSFRVEVALLLS